jgi:hypothetical protein
MKHIENDNTDQEKALKAQNILLQLGFEKREGDNFIIYFRFKGWIYHINFFVRGADGSEVFSWQAISCGEKEGVNAIDSDTGEGLYRIGADMPEKLQLSGGDTPQSKRRKSKSDMYRHLALRGGPAYNGGDWANFERAVNELMAVLSLSIQEKSITEDVAKGKDKSEQSAQLALF